MNSNEPFGEPWCKRMLGHLDTLNHPKMVARVLALKYNEHFLGVQDELPLKTTKTIHTTKVSLTNGLL